MNFSSSPIARREFLRSAAGSMLACAAMVPAGARAAGVLAPRIMVEDPDGALARTQAPVSVLTALEGRLHRATAEGRLQLREPPGTGNDAGQRIPVQVLGSGPGPAVRLCWLMPEGPKGRRVFLPVETTEPASTAPLAVQRQPDGQFEISEAGKPVLRYNYAKVEPGSAFLASVSEGNRKYAVARSDYIHPLYGPHGEELTKDWSPDHPHHRGIYWAWPEVDWHGQRADLHALQNVFARPTGKCEVTGGRLFAQIDAENLWQWEDREPIVRERSIIRAYRATSGGRLVDLEFHFIALGGPVLLARRGAAHYGGLNLRFNAVKDQRITKHTAPAEANPRPAWGDLSGTFAGATEPAGVTVIQYASNPDYPGDWVEYSELNWLQPTFPAAGSRYELSKGKELVLRFRLWIHAGGEIAETVGADHWSAANARFSPGS